MSLTTSTNMQTIMSMLNQTAGQISGSSDVTPWFNTCSSLWDYAKTMEEGNEEQKVNGTVNFAQKLLSAIMSMHSNRATEDANKTSASVQKQTQQNQQQQQKADQKVQQDKASTDAKVAENQGKIDGMMSEKDVLEQDRKDAAKEIKDTQEKIEAKKQELNDPAKSKEEKLSILGEVIQLGGELATISENLENLNNKYVELGGTLEATQANTKAIAQDGAAAVQGDTQKLANVASGLTKTTQEGVVKPTGEAAKNTAVAVAAEAAAAVADKLPAGAGAKSAYELRKTAADNRSAATVNGQTATTTGSSVTQTAAQATQTGNRIADFACGLVGSLQQQGVLVGQVGANLSDLTSGVGSSINPIATVGSEVTAAATGDQAALQESGETNGQTPQGDGGNNGDGNGDGQKQLETPKVDTSEIKTPDET